MRDYDYVNCDVAREALSARIDGEREPVPAARVDEHLEDCAECRAWRDQATAQADVLRRLSRQQPVAAVATGSPQPTAARTFGIGWPRAALLVVGLAQCAVGGAQAWGLDLGLHGAHEGLHTGSYAGGTHLFNESTAWTLAIGLVMVAAALRPALAAGLAGVLATFTVVLGAYVVVDALAGAVTLQRMLSHLPVLLGAVLAVLVWRRAAVPPPTPHAAQDAEITLPRNASRGRRRGHLWPTDGSAA